MKKIARSSFRPFCFKRWFCRFGWFVVVLACISVLYLDAMQQKDQSYHEMVVMLERLEKDKTLALAVHEDLLLQIQSQSDPTWVEMVLKRNLGMVCEGQVKVYFDNNP